MNHLIKLLAEINSIKETEIGDSENIY